MTNEYLEAGNYEIEVMGTKYPAQIYLQSPFDRENKRLKGQYPS